MADIHDQALEWAQQNSQDPRAQDIMAKSWAAKNPQDPRSAQIMQKFQPQDKLSQLKQRIEPQDPWMKEAALNAGMGNVANLAGEPIAKLASFLGGGIAKGGSALLQKAVGMKKYVPGVGEELAKQGVMGTKGAMQVQIEKALESQGQKIGEIAKGIPEVSTQPVAEKLGEQAAKRIGPSGVIPEEAGLTNRYIDEATSASRESIISGPEAAFRRSRYGKIARDAGKYRDNPAQGVKAEMSGAKQSGYSEALKNADPTGQLAPIDKSYSLLSKADQAINQPESLSGLKGMLNALPTSLVESTAGRAGIGAGKFLQKTQPQNLGMKQVPKRFSSAPTLLEMLRGNKGQE